MRRFAQGKPPHHLATHVQNRALHQYLASGAAPAVEEVLQEVANGQSRALVGEAADHLDRFLQPEGRGGKPLKEAREGHAQLGPTSRGEDGCDRWGPSH